MIATLRPLTYDDLLALPDDGQRYEIIGGELIVTPAPSWNHQSVLGEIYSLIRAYLRGTSMGKVVFAPFDVVLGQNDIVEPDLVVIGANQDQVAGTQNTFEGAPLLVVEVISPSSRQSDHVKKLMLYARAGVQEYWIADPGQQTLIINILQGETYVPVQPDNAGQLSSRALPGLHVDPATIFAEMD